MNALRKFIPTLYQETETYTAPTPVKETQNEETSALEAFVDRLLEVCGC